jgi:hypothetical protein
MADVDKRLKVINTPEGSVYTAQIKLKSGETAYFASEPIATEKRSKQVCIYKEWTDSLCNETRGSIGVPIKYNDWLNKFLGKDFLKDYFLKADQFQESYSQLLKKIKDKDDEEEKNTIAFEKRSRTKKKSTLNGIRSGVVGLQTSVGYRFNYISKKPVTGIYPFPGLEDSGNDYSQIGLYIKFYGNIIMCISSYPGTNSTRYHHRGIFRNPISVLEDNYKGVGLQLHAFTAAAWGKSYPEAKTMNVNPDGNFYMEDLLKKEYAGSIQKSTESSGYDIPIDALLQRFAKHFDIINGNSIEKEIEIVEKDNKKEEVKK